MQIFQVDAFTEKKYQGNPAMVCMLDTELDGLLMQQIAKEMNLSETAFILKKEGHYDLRWFTPLVEVNLCGHATLASAFVIYNEGLQNESEIIEFHTKSGILKVSNKGNGLLEMDFPTVFSAQVPAPQELVDALNSKIVSCTKSAKNYLVELENDFEVRNVKPDFALLKRLPMQGVIVTAKADSRYDFISRYFCPAIGIDEDPVTGSSHCMLVPFWSEKLGKKEMVAYQASERGGELFLKLSGDRVIISGKAVMVLKGALV